MRWKWATNWSTDDWSTLSCRLTAHRCTRQPVVGMWTSWNCWCNIKPHWIHTIRWAHELWNASLSRGFVCLWAEQAYCTLLRSSTQTWCSRGSLARGRWHGEWRSVYRQGVVGERRRLLFWSNIWMKYCCHCCHMKWYRRDLFMLVICHGLGMRWALGNTHTHFWAE